MRMGFLPSRNVSRDESLFITASNDGATLDAQAAVGREYALIGTTTRAVIARLLCVSVGPVKYQALGPIYWYQADGDEFTGVFKLTPEGGAGAVTTWGTAGARATGGPQLPYGGTLGLAGLAAFRGWQRNIEADIRIATIETPTDVGDALWAGWRRAATTTLEVMGLVWTGSIWASAGATAGDRDTPTLTATSSYGTLTTGEHQLAATVYPATAAATAAIIVGGARQPARQATQQALSGLADQSTDDRYPCIGCRGSAWVARLVELNLQGYA